MEALLPLAIASTGAGIASQVMGGLKRSSISDLAAAPLDVSSIYTPMSEAERRARERQIMANLVSRNIPADSAYATALTAEGMAGTETNRYLAALDAALQKRGQRLRTEASTLSPGFGDVGGLGQYFMLNKILEAIKGPRSGAAPKVAPPGILAPGFYPETFMDVLDPILGFGPAFAI